MAKTIGLLTAGGDSPGLNAAIRGIGKAALGAYGMRIIVVENDGAQNGLARTGCRHRRWR